MSIRKVSNRGFFRLVTRNLTADYADFAERKFSTAVICGLSNRSTAMRINRTLLIGALTLALSASAWAQAPDLPRPPLPAPIDTIRPPGSVPNSDGASPSQAGGRTFHRPVTHMLGLASEQPWRVGAMKLIAPGVGWAKTNHGLLWTEDGGTNWKEITPHLARDEVLGSIFFLDPSRGWITINHNQPPSEEPRFEVASTTETGASWLRLTVPLLPKDYGVSTEFPLRGGAGTIAFADPVHGWMNVWFGGETPNSWSSFLLVTSDGGRTWSRAANAPDLSSSEMLLVSPSEGWLFGVDHGTSTRLYVTRDGAHSWQEVAPELAALQDSQVMGLPTFEDAQHGFLQVNGVGREDRESRLTMVLTETVDGGRTWKPDRAVVNLDDIARSQYGSPTVVASDWIFAAASDHHPVLTKLGPGARIDVNTDAPASRRRYTDVGQISFSSPTAAWAIVGDGELKSTEDGGSTWTNISPGPKPQAIEPSIDPSSGKSASRLIAPESYSAGSLAPSSVHIATHDSLGQNPKISKHMGIDVSHTGTPAEMYAWWNNSPYYDVGVYLNGAEGHTFNDPNLRNANWVNTVMGYGWGLIPIWFGPQNPCATIPYDQRIPFSHTSEPEFNTTQGGIQALKAVGSANISGIPKGSIIYYDMEAYASSCHPIENNKPNNKITVNGSEAAVSFFEGWIAELHKKGFDAGIYVSGGDAQDLPDITDSVWIAAPGPPSEASVWGLGYWDTKHFLDDSQFTDDQRIHQYDLGPDNTGIPNIKFNGTPMNDYFGRSLKIDLDIEDAEVVAGNALLKPLPASYDEVDFQSDNAPITYVTGINNPNLGNNPPDMYGTIVGYNLNDGPNTYNAYGFFDTSGSGAVQGGMTNLSCSGAVYTFPLNISNLGNIVGYYDYADGSGVYYSFTSSVQFPDCQDVGGSNGFFGINDAGWIAGASPWFEGATSWNSFLQTSDTYYMFQIGSGYFSDVDNVNGLGQMIGNYASDTENSGFIDDTGSGNPMDGNIITDFPNAFPISQDWIFTNLDNNQDIAGLAFDDNNDNQYGFVLSALGAAGGDDILEGSGNDLVLGINDYRQIVGATYNPSNGGYIGWVRFPDNGNQ
jgi:photosystem II stability/assembly factor-like uncharacterized protein